MKNSEQPNDIATEPYQGPGSFVAGAGYVYLSHWIAAFAGAVAFGAVGVLFSGKTIAFKEMLSEFGLRHRDSANWFKKAAGTVADFVPRMADKAAEKFLGATKRMGGNRLNTSSVSDDTKTAGLFSAGIGSITGFLGSTFWGFAKGHKEGNRGKHQFERAQHEIKNLRELNADLERINNDLHKKYIEAATEKPGKTALNSAQHDGMLQAEKVATPEIA